MYNGTQFNLINNEEDNFVFLAWEVLNSDNFSIFSKVQEMHKSFMERPPNWK